MTSGGRRSVRTQFVLLAVVISTCVIMPMTAAAVLVQVRQFRLEFAAELAALGSIVAGNSTAVAAFEARREAAELLETLAPHRAVTGAALVGADGAVLAAWRRGGSEGAAEAIDAVRADGVRASTTPVVVGGEVVAVLVLASDYERLLGERVRQWTGIAAGAAVAAVVLSWALAARFERVLTGPLRRLAEFADAVAAEPGTGRRASTGGLEEVDRVAEALNRMLDELSERDGELQRGRQDLARQVEALTEEVARRRETQKALEDLNREAKDLARRAGMAEVATGVLHNIGNVLNSINVSAAIAQERLAALPAGALERLAHAMGEPSFVARLADPDSAAPVRAFAAELAAELRSVHATVEREIGSLRHSVEHLKEVVARQQNLARGAPMRDRMDVVEAVEDALLLVRASFEAAGIQVTREFRAVPAVVADRNQVVQILHNLLRNAQASIEAQRPPARLVEMRVGPGAGGVVVGVSDNGLGIEEANLTRIFAAGFTTKKDGHGFGLHGGANSARAMGGSLTAWSEGPGRGATFTLELPVAEPGEAPAK